MFLNQYKIKEEKKEKKKKEEEEEGGRRRRRRKKKQKGRILPAQPLLATLQRYGFPLLFIFLRVILYAWRIQGVTEFIIVLLTNETQWNNSLQEYKA